jgi:hypothetical protein
MNILSAKPDTGRSRPVIVEEVSEYEKDQKHKESIKE